MNHADQPTQSGEALLPCRYCGLATKRSVLSMLGARCVPCYDGYTREKPTGPRVPKDAIPASAGQRAWAFRLKWREESGELLSPLQRSMWRSVIEANRVLDSAREGGDEDPEAIAEALRATGDLVDKRARERARLAADPRFAGWVAGQP